MTTNVAEPTVPAHTNAEVIFQFMLDSLLDVQQLVLALNALSAQQLDTPVDRTTEQYREWRKLSSLLSKIVDALSQLSIDSRRLTESLPKDKHVRLLHQAVSLCLWQAQRATSKLACDTTKKTRLETLSCCRQVARHADTALELWPKILSKMQPNTTAVLFLLRQRKRIDVLHCEGFTTDLLATLFPQGVESLLKHTSQVLQQRHFKALVPQLHAQINELQPW